ncbi:MAG: protein translocase subunit SecF, partial [Pseudomonadales bacterium]
MTEFKFDFMKYRFVTAWISGALVVVAIVSLAVNQLEWGLDFTGGTLVEVVFEQSVDPQALREQLSEAGYVGHVVQY